jgi:hemolysin III
MYWIMQPFIFPLQAATRGIALTGIVIKIFFTGRFKLLSTLSYLVMGWVMIVAIKPLIHNLPLAGLLWIAGGGLLYTLGAILYQMKRIPFNHAVFHFFVLAAAVCHFIAVYVYAI